MKQHCSCYDINCQYRRHFKSWIEEIRRKFPHLTTIQVKYFPWTLAGIGKFHAPAHTASCRYRFSFNFLSGIGMTDGEALEQIWAVLNNIAAHLKEMSSGHRHDVINDFHSDHEIW